MLEMYGKRNFSNGFVRPSGPGELLFFVPLTMGFNSLIVTGDMSCGSSSGGHFLDDVTNSWPRNSSMLMLPATGSGAAIFVYLSVMC